MVLTLHKFYVIKNNVYKGVFMTFCLLQVNDYVFSIRCVDDNPTTEFAQAHVSEMYLIANIKKTPQYKS